MRVFVAGATGVIGRRLLPLLRSDGHEVTGMVRAPRREAAVRELGAEPAIADAMDAAAVRGAIEGARPDVVVHELTSLPRRIDPRKLERDFARNDRLRTDGTRNLVDAAQAAGVSRIVAQSVAFAYAPGPPGAIHTEDDPLYLDAPKQFARTMHAVAELERAVLGAGGLVLRYGYFYGPGSSISRDGTLCQDLARRRLPVVGGGRGVWSFIHVDDAARATVQALTNGAGGAYNVVDDDPAPVAEWLPALAQAVGAPRPLRVPTLLAYPLAGRYGVLTMTRSQGASNALARRVLAWQPRYASWRDGFRLALG
ncbi:MAG TPA: NAD(P)-dependent oxidoreductase [Solirubrobacteraceae bacterium]|jgi:nucleoside-diphosphate-sugar epimerase|nr:NAD(P)-dependent oxidoreductase [Solirubrobacteraceae bacterium]